MHSKEDVAVPCRVSDSRASWHVARRSGCFLGEYVHTGTPPSCFAFFLFPKWAGGTLLLGTHLNGHHGRRLWFWFTDAGRWLLEENNPFLLK